MNHMLAVRRFAAGDAPAAAAIIRGLPDHFTDDVSAQVERDAARLATRQPSGNLRSRSPPNPMTVTEFDAGLHKWINKWTRRPPRDIGGSEAPAHHRLAGSSVNTTLTVLRAPVHRRSPYCLLQMYQQVMSGLAWIPCCDSAGWSTTSGAPWARGLPTGDPTTRRP
jgi:hypothetical protein